MNWMSSDSSVNPMTVVRTVEYRSRCRMNTQRRNANRAVKCIVA
jgi:hypothetical protein